MTTGRMVVKVSEWFGRTYDLAVIGGGINGAAIARDAALRGLSVLLLEKADFASGTSSKSSKLIHGGLRYLEHYEFGLVRESLRERARLVNNAPHLVKPLPFVLPLLEGASRPPWMLTIGLTLYDWLAGRSKHFPPHTRMAAEQFYARFPGFSAGASGAFQYFDAQMDDSRLVLENVLAAERLGAIAVNYCEVRSLLQRRGKICGVRVAHACGECEIMAKTVVQATGVWTKPWTNTSDGGPRIRPSKGTHLVLPDLGFRAGLTLPVPDSQRVFFILPWHGRTLVGTTDDDYAGDLDSVRPTPAEVDALLAGVRHYLPDRSLESSHVISAFAGLRPLLDHSGSSAKATREHAIFVNAEGLITVCGGKYTTYRAIAEEVVDRIADVPRASTCDRSFDSDFGESSSEHLDQLPADLAARLRERYGPRADEVARTVGEQPNGTARLGDTEYTLGEVDYAVLSEHAVNLDDWLCRRTPLTWTHRDTDAALATAVAHRMATHLGWSPEETKRQVEVYSASRGTLPGSAQTVSAARNTTATLPSDRSMLEG